MAQETPKAPGKTSAQYGYPGPGEGRGPLDAFFAPRGVAVIGASEKAGSVGRSVLWNLISSPFGGTVYPVNPRRDNILGIKAYAGVAHLPPPVDLAVVITPAKTVPGIITECIDVGIRGAIIISAGFGETGEPGRALEEELRQLISPGKIRVIGPNSLGIMNPVIGLNAAFAGAIARKGTVGFISQSGALCAAILDWSLRVNVGFSAFVSFGTMVDVGWADLIYYLGNDPNTKSILIYMQTVGDARSFLSAAREVALNKPIILLKAGQSEEAARAARATPYFDAADTASDEVLSAAFRRSGILRVDTIESLFSMAEVLSKQPRPKGPRLTILSNSAGPGILATDALVNGGGELTELSEETLAELNALLPPYWNHTNPIDIVADADPQRYANAAEISLRDKNSDGLLVVLTPQVMTDATRTAERIAALKSSGRKPILASWMGGDSVAAGAAILNSHNIPVFPYPDMAAQVFNAMWRYSYNLRGLYETPVAAPDSEAAVQDHAAAAHIIGTARATGQIVLSECDSKRILAAYGIPVVETGVASSADEAVAIAERMGYPVVLTFNAYPSQRKRGADIYLNLANEPDVRRAYDALQATLEEKGVPPEARTVAIRAMIQSVGYRIVIGSMVDPLFGPVLFFGSGGPLGDVFCDHVPALPPLNSTLARRMMEQTRIYAALKGSRGFSPVDLAALEQILVRFSHLIVDQRWIKEINVNPFLAAPDRLVGLDARITLHPPETPEAALPPLAIRPYPSEYTAAFTMKNGEAVLIRPIRPEDEAMMVKFHESLSKDTVYFRYLQQLALDQRIKHDRLAEICFIDYDRAMTLVAVRRTSATDTGILAVCRMVKLPAGGNADFAIVVQDACQGLGLGAEMMRRLIHVAQAEHVNRLVGIIHPDNRNMLRLCAKLGFRLHKPAGEEVIAEMSIQAAGATA